MDNRQGERQLAVGLCAALFIIFGFCFLRGLHSFFLENAQWILSHHQTRYMPLASPLMIVGTLLAVVVLACRFVKVSPVAHAVLYAPSFWLLALLTCAQLPMPAAASDGWSWIGFTMWAVLVLLAMWVTLRTFPASYRPKRSYSSATIVFCNAGIMLIHMLCATMASNTHSDTHIAMQMSHLAKEGRYDEIASYKLVTNPSARELGVEAWERTQQCSRSIYAMRAYALSREGLLPERLFACPQPHGALGLIPPKADSSYVFNWPDALYHHLGTVCRDDITQSWEVLGYLKNVQRRHPDSRAVADYLLCAYLLERRLDDFARELTQYYTINDSLPRHYKEALVTYQRRSQTPILQYHNEEIEANYAGFIKLKASVGSAAEQELKLRDMYPETYWCHYYFYEKQDK